MTNHSHLPRPEPLPIKKSTKHHPFISADCVRRVERILDERRNLPSPVPKQPILNNLVHPLGLLPIHLSNKPISVEYSPPSLPNPPIRKRPFQELANQRSSSTIGSDTARPRKKHKFIDDSAIESDGEGGDVLSVRTTPPNSRPSSPTSRKLVSKVFCDTCQIYLSGSLQYQIHIKSKKHLRRLRTTEDSISKLCNRFFQSKHNKDTHKCKNFFKSEKFYKLPS